MVVAGRATDSGQKVHNLRVATRAISQRIKYLAFVDSDARPRPEWLRALVSRLERPGLGAVTGYRWFTPAAASLANALVYSMNCDVISLLDPQQPLSDLGRLVGHPPRSVRRRRPAQRLEGDLERRSGGQPADAAGAAARSVSSRPAWWPRRWTYRWRRRMAFIRRQYLVARLYTFDWWLFSLVAATFSQRRSGWATWACWSAGLLTGSPRRGFPSPSAPCCTW